MASHSETALAALFREDAGWTLSNLQFWIGRCAAQGRAGLLTPALALVVGWIRDYDTGLPEATVERWLDCEREASTALTECARPRDERVSQALDRWIVELIGGEDSE